MLREGLARLKKVTSRNQILYKLRTILETAQAWDVLEDAPKIKIYKEPKKADPIVYTEEQADRLLAAALADTRENAAILLLLLHCSLRVSEVCALRWSDVDFRRKLVTICHNYSDGEDSTPKGMVSAPVGLTPALAAALRALPRGHDHVLVRTYKGEVTHHSAHSIRVRLNAIQRAAGRPRSPCASSSWPGPVVPLTARPFGDVFTRLRLAAVLTAPLGPRTGRFVTLALPLAPRTVPKSPDRALPAARRASPYSPSPPNSHFKPLKRITTDVGRSAAPRSPRSSTP